MAEVLTQIPPPLLYFMNSEYDFKSEYVLSQRTETDNKSTAMEKTGLLRCLGNMCGLKIKELITDMHKEVKSHLNVSTYARGIATKIKIGYAKRGGRVKKTMKSLYPLSYHCSCDLQYSFKGITGPI